MQLKSAVPLSLKKLLLSFRDPTRRAALTGYERWSSMICGGEVLIDPSSLHGRYWIDVRSHLLKRILVTGSYEPKVVEILERNCNRDFLDIGANVGFFSIHMSSRASNAGRVVAVEPNPKALEYLHRNVSLNLSTDLITVVDKAISDRDGTMDLSVIEGHEEYSSLVEIGHSQLTEVRKQSVKVQVTTVDSLVDELGLVPGLIKIDVEGAEGQVLRGMTKTLETYQPVVVCEVGGNAASGGLDYAGSPSSIQRLFIQAGYQLHTLDGLPTELKDGIACEVVATPRKTG